MTEIKLYNTLHRQIEEFKPIEDGQVRMYTCGPTVYDFAHVGNLRSYIFADLVRRVLAFNNYTVTQAMNITDVGHLVGDGDEGEDKLEVGAKREGKSPLEVAKRYEEQFFTDLKALNIVPPDKIKRATDDIPEQIKLIQRLDEKGFVYKTDAALYFDTSKVSDYGKLTGQKREDMLTGARSDVVVDSQKRHPQDFALWFFLTGRYQNHILHWASPWGEGFPGWHLECSAISRELLGQPFDIHTGGVDHIGTHHTNEIAQSEAAYNQPLANYWLHNEFLLVDEKRMGKSEGNFITLKDIQEKGFAPSDLRYLCLQSHYRSKMNFTWEALEGAKNTLRNIETLVLKTENVEKYKDSDLNELRDILNNDLDTPRFLATLHEKKDGALWFQVRHVLGILLGNLFDYPEEIHYPPIEIKQLMEERELAKIKKDWNEADKIRKEINLKGYGIKDTPEGTRIFTKTKTKEIV